MSVSSFNSRWNAPPSYDARSSSTLTPYLQLPHLLSLTWLAYPILSLAFVAFRLQLSLAASQDAVANAKGDLLTSCKAAEHAATAAASMPRYMALASNEQFADTVNGTLKAARATLIMALTIMEAVINFIIDIYRSTFLCFLELVVRGGLAILIGAVQELNTLVQNVANGLRTSIQNDISAANSAIKTAIDAINKINPFNDIKAPQINVPSLDGLQNISLPPTFQQALTNLNNSIPSVSVLKDKVESIIDTPFELLKKDINDTFANISFDPSGLPIPKQNQLTFCNDMDMSVVDDIGHDLIKVAKIGTIVLIVLALLLIGLNCLLEWYKWRCMKAHMEYTRQAWITDPTVVNTKPTAGTPQVVLSDHNLLMLQADSSHPLLTRILNLLSVRLRLSPTQHTHLRWFFHYIFHPPALACFLIGFIGLLSVQIQLWAMQPLVHKYQAKSADTANDFSNTIALAVNASMYNQSASYANDVNARVDAIQTTVNDGVFGWVNVTTVTLNNTIEAFYTDIEDAVNSVFGGTILQQPAQDFLRCILGSKVDAIEKALTFLHDNLRIDVPRVNDTVLVLSPDSVNEATRPIATAAIGGGEGDNQGLLGRLVESYAASLKKERIMFAIFMGLWGLVVLMALCIIFWHSYGKRLVEARKRRKWEREQRGGIDGLIVPFKLGMPQGEEKRADGAVDLPSFTPMPSPKANSLKLFSFGRSASPATFRSDQLDVQASSPTESGETKNNKSWISLWGAKSGTKPNNRDDSKVARKPNKLRAIGRKGMGREQLVPDEDASLQDAAHHDEPLSSEDAKNDDQRNTAWFGRIATMLEKKAEPEPLPSGRPNLRISIDPSAAIRNGNSATTQPTAHDGEPSSRLFSSPTVPRADVAPWSDMTPRPTIGAPIRSKPQNTASNVGATFGPNTVNPLKPVGTPIAPPLHHGFDGFSKLPIPAPPRRAPTSRQQQQQQRLVPPLRWAERHGRTPSDMPAPLRKNSSPTGEDGTSVTPVTQLLTTHHARRSSPINPFFTPFDDEHRVTVASAPQTRKSIPTNPFQPIAI